MKVSPITIGVALVVIALIIFFAQDVFRKPQSISTLPTAIPTPTSQKPVALTTPISKPLSQTKTFPHELLPGFNITIPNSWYISGIKQFGEKDTIGFTSNYFPSLPPENAMAIRIFKNGTFFDLIFDLVFDDQNSCSNDLKYVDIGNNWYQLRDNRGFYYSRGVMFNSSMIGSNQKFKVCTSSGSLLSNKPNKIISPYGEGAIMLENIRIYGSPSQEVIDEINTIVRSITL